MRSASAICCVAGRLRMAADEQQPQDVVAVVRAVQPFGDRGCSASSRSEIAWSSSGSGSLLAGAAHLVDGRCCGRP